MSSKRLHYLLITLTLSLSACMQQVYQPQPLDPQSLARGFQQRNLEAESLQQFMRDHHYQVSHWPLVGWDHNALILAAIHFHPDLTLARAHYKLSQAAEISAGQKPNPEIGISPQVHSDTQGGKSPLELGFLLDWPLERQARRQARIDVASFTSQAGLSDIRQTAWTIRHRVKQSYLDLIDARHRSLLLRQSEGLLKENLGLLQRRQELGESAGFELSSQRLELHRLQLEILLEESKVSDALHNLAESLGLPLTALQGADISATGADLSAQTSLPEISVLQSHVLQSREDILASLQRYAASEAALREAVEKQQPDIILSPAYLFDQGDNIWALGVSWILPLFASHEGPIAEARAQRDLRAAQFIALQSRLIAKLQKHHALFQHRQKAWQTAGSLETELRERLEVMERQFRLGYTDRLELNRHRLELYRMKRSRHDLRFQALRSLAALEDSAQQSLRHQPQLWDPALLTVEKP